MPGISGASHQSRPGGCGRYPLCYNAAKGKVFDRVLDFNCSFEQYTRRLLAYDLKWETDELYFGACVDQRPHGVAIRKLREAGSTAGQSGASTGFTGFSIRRKFWMTSISIAI
jgi:hypothetical protein